jgi:predicted GTPase
VAAFFVGGVQTGRKIAQVSCKWLGNGRKLLEKWAKADRKKNVKKPVRDTFRDTFRDTYEVFVINEFRDTFQHKIHPIKWYKLHKKAEKNGKKRR